MRSCSKRSSFQKGALLISHALGQLPALIPQPSGHAYGRQRPTALLSRARSAATNRSSSGERRGGIRRRRGSLGFLEPAQVPAHEDPLDDFRDPQNDQPDSDHQH
jgi:hypothetical protein